MTDKERLEFVKNNVTPVISELGIKYAYEVTELDFDWLIEQAKENQSNDKQMLIKANIAKQRKIDDLELQVESLGSALHTAQHEIRVLKGRQDK